MMKKSEIIEKDLDIIRKALNEPTIANAQDAEYAMGDIIIEAAALEKFLKDWIKKEFGDLCGR